MWGPNYGTRVGGFAPAYTPTNMRMGSQPRAAVTGNRTPQANSDNGTPSTTTTPATPTPTTPAPPDLSGNPFAIGVPGSSNSAYTAGTLPPYQSAPLSIAPTTAQVNANPASFAGTSWGTSDPAISAFLAQQVASRRGSGADGGGTPAGYGQPGFDYTQDPAYAGSYNANIPDPNAPPPGATQYPGGSAYRLPWGGTWFQPGSVNNNSSAAYETWRRNAYGV